MLTLIAGILSGNCMLPMKFMRSWKWENTWAVFSIVSLVLIPWVLGLALVENLGGVYEHLLPAQLILPFLLGAGWGVAQILFGISVNRLGLGLAYAIIVGLGAVLGTMVPFLIQQRRLANENSMAFVLVGVAVMVVGIVLCARGGQLRERDAPGIPDVPVRQGYAGALLLAILCGVMAPMLNYSFAFGQDIAKEAVRMGNTPIHAAYAVWPVALAGGFVPNISYAVYLLTTHRTWSRFQSINPDLSWSCFMGALWMGAFAIYGMSAIYLGALGTSIGWGLLQIFMIMTATLSGVLTGEWRKASRAAILFLGAGLVCLTCATVLLAWGNG
jgi:L-rhamnose-H+ transport protein